jgi:hypothetical protein
VLADCVGVKFKENAVAAVIAYKSRINKIFSLESYCCEVFDCRQADFTLYRSIFDGFAAASHAARPAKTQRAAKSAAKPR